MPIVLEKYPLLIFDWDGTLVDSIGRIVHCFEQTYAFFDISPPPAQAIRETIGLPLREGFRKLSVGLAHPGIEALALQYRDVWLDPDLAPSPLFSGVKQLLISLKAKGHTLAVATGKSRAGLDREASYHQVLHHFETSICGDEAQPKPDPDMLNRIAGTTKFKEQEILVFGDSTLDLSMAKQASMASVGVLSGTGHQTTLEHHTPLTCLQEIGLLANFITS